IWIFLVVSCSIGGFGDVPCLVNVFRFSVAVEFVLVSSLFRCGVTMGGGAFSGAGDLGFGGVCSQLAVSSGGGGAL
ncbi:hypothetical protein A2U01_0040303, partial [Trifolium medium]|nr:hypothetical protein [Trifolium medium]